MKKLFSTVFLIVIIITLSIFLFYSKEKIVSQSSISCLNCNVILISLDSLRQDHLSLYDYSRKTSPRLDKWAQNAFIFDQHIVTSHITPVSEMSLHTSLYPSSSGVINFSTLLSENKKTLAEILKEYGYKTVAIGSSNEFVPKFEVMRKNFSRGFDRYLTEHLKESFNTEKYTTEEIYTNFLPDIKDWSDYSTIRDRRGLPLDALSYLRNTSGEKFFLWVPIGTIHWPYQGSNINKPTYFSDTLYDGIFKNDPLEWFMLSRVFNGYFYPREKGELPQPLDSKDIQFLHDRYDDGIFLVDQFLGELFSVLKETKLDKKTVIIISSEHGEDFGEHGYFAHYDIFDTQIRTPLVIKFPNIKGRRIDEQISNIDILPTLLETLGIPIPNQVEGKSFFSFLFKEDVSPPREYAFIERTPLWENIIINNVTTLPTEEKEWLNEFKILDDKNSFKDIAVRTKDWKLIYRKSFDIQKRFSWWQHLSGKSTLFTEYELYNLIEDPNEKKNVFDQYPEIGLVLKEVLLTWDKQINKKGASIQQINGPLQPYF
ncbi:MAG: sulfatase [Parcubacteria group bacterium]|nr:sulfatase [Parcubacteria group bacterium]